jgi:hypothetical protein
MDKVDVHTLFIVHLRLENVENESEATFVRTERTRTLKTSFPNSCDPRLRNFFRLSMIDCHFLRISHVMQVRDAGFSSNHIDGLTQGRGAHFWAWFTWILRA